MKSMKSVSILLVLSLVFSGCLGESESNETTVVDLPPTIAYQPIMPFSSTTIYTNATSQNNTIVFFGLDLDLDGSHDVTLDHNQSVEVNVGDAVQTFMKGGQDDDSPRICTYNFALMATDDTGLSTYTMGLLYTTCS
jgi:hypothetical protein